MIERRNYALVLLDLQMPRANGFDVVERLRTKDTRPVIIAGTARSMGEYFTTLRWIAPHFHRHSESSSRSDAGV